MENLPVVTADLELAVQGLALRYRKANGPVMSLMNRIGGSVEERVALLPQAVRTQLESVTRMALERAHGMAAMGSRLGPDLGERGPVLAAMATGLAGGMGGLPTAIAELPVTITLFLHTIRAAAIEAGFDADDPGIRAECLQVFAAGSPLRGDDGVNTSFIGARLAVSTAAIQKMIAVVVPKLGLAMGQKLAVQAVPVLGAVTGAALNAAYLSYYRETARVRFGLLRLAEVHGAEATLRAFQAAVTVPSLMKG
jgi:EcsC protein family